MSENRLESFTFHGLTFSANGSSQPKADCLFCGKEDHFHVNQKTGQWDCKVCGERGNLYSFLAKLHADRLKATKREDWQALSEARKGVPWTVFRDAGIAADLAPGRWLIPGYNVEHAFSNLYVWDGPGTRVMGTTGLKHQLFGINELSVKGPIFICEGSWDRLALLWLLSLLKLPASVLGVPGANTFKVEWLPLLDRREVYLCYDNDAAGQSGQAALARKLDSRAESVRLLRWPSAVSEGYDLNDFIASRFFSS